MKSLDNFPNVDRAYNEFINLFRDKLDKVCPLDKIKTVHKVEQKPWITSTLKKLYKKEK